MNKKKLLKKVLASPNNVQFSEMMTLVEAFGFQLSRVKGSHHIFVHPGLSALVNIQEVQGRPSRIKFDSF